MPGLHVDSYILHNNRLYLCGMKTRYILFLILSCLLCPARLDAGQAPYIFRHIGVANGLPDNYVKSIFRIPDGRLGVRTTVLLSLYDGSSFSDFPYDTRDNYYIDYDHVIPRQYVDADSRIWMKERGLLRVFDLSTERYINNIDSLLFRFGLKEKIADMFIDSNQRYWFVTSGYSVYSYAPSEKKLEEICTNDEFVRHNGTLREVASYGDLCWMVHRKGMIRCYDLKQKRFVRQEDFLVGKMKSEDQAILEVLDNGDYWLMWDRGAGYYDTHTNEWTEMTDIYTNDYTMLTTITTDNDGNLWIGSVSNGAYHITRRNFSVTHLKTFPLLTGGVIQNDIHSIFFDKQSGGLWIGFYNQGICYYHPTMNNFPVYNKENVSGDWKDESVRCMLETKNGNVLIGTAKGLYRYNPKTGVMDIPYKELNHQICRKLYRDSHNRIWLGTFHDGLYSIIDGKVKSYSYPNMNYQNDPDYSNIRAILEDKKGRIWLSVYGGVGAFNPENGEIDLLFNKHPLLKKYKTANTLELDNQGRLIVGADNGLYFYDPEKDSVYIPEIDEPGNALYNHESNKYNCILRDSRDALWFGTQYGLNVVTKEQKIYRIGKENGLFNTTIQSIQEDNNGDIWLSTINSLCKIKVESGNGDYSFHVISFASESGWQRDDLYEFSSLKTKNGTLYFGRVNGFNAFTPENIAHEQAPNRPLITSLRLFNTPVLPGNEYNGRILFDKAINSVEKVSLDYDENFITLDFSGLNFMNPSQTFFRYCMEGFDKGWTELQSENGQGRVTYNNLPPGEYVFKVVTAGSNKVWGEESALSFTIHPPFWDTIAARIIYSILFCLLMGGVITFLNRRNRRKLLQAQEQEALRQKEELDQMKFRFFTNISHELRTPLTLIITPLDMLRRKVADETIGKQLNNIYRNAQELLVLVNQLLDFRKLEMKGETLHLMNGDIEEFVTSISHSFMPMAAEKHFNFINQSECRALYMYFDRDKVHKIVNNLLSNAFKFTKEGGTIKLQLSKEELDGRWYARMEVSDTGIGISETDLPHIFDRFYQVQNKVDEKPGSGIGLHLIKEYVNIHEGKIAVDSHVGQGSVFTVWLPVDLKPEKEVMPEPSLTSPAEREQPSVEDLSAEALPADDGRKKLLIVEDNKEFRSFLKEQLGEFYKVIEAADGEEGEKQAVDENPDLIVSDIMMPKMDGIELCRRIKTNVQTSHIPVVLLTARTADDVKISSYEVGADSYMSKPFSFDMLLIRVRKLIEQQEKRKQNFRKNLEVNPGKITITPLDEQLIQKALECVEKNMDNTGYAVEDLSRDLGMTRMNLYRKLQSITGHTPTDFIKSIRLKRAAQLLQGSQLNIVEIADRVGFSSSSYFTKCFKDMFELLPTQYAEKCRNEQE